MTIPRAYRGFDSAAGVYAMIENGHTFIATTLPTRNHNSISYLEDIVSLHMSMTPWTADIAPESVVSEDVRKQVDALFKEKFGTLVQVF